MRKRYINSALEKRIHWLAVEFSEETLVPGRYKPSDNPDKKKVVRKNSKVERAFFEAKEEWTETIAEILNSTMDDAMINRLIYLKLDPNDPFDYDSVTLNRDWSEFNEFFIGIRAKDNPSVTGKLSMLIGAYQKLLENKLAKRPGLKNNKAQELLEKGVILLDGHEIRMWRGASRNTVQTQESWNKVGSLKELNHGLDPSAYRVCFTGVFQIPRQEIFEYASALGFHVQTSVNGRTNLLVFGSENAGPNKISDYIDRRSSGQDIQLMDENAFLDMLLNSGIIPK